MGLYVGIDGGGTHSTAAAAWPDGRIAAVTEGQGLNFHNVGVEPVRLRLEEMVQTLEAQAGAPAEKICVGMSALDGPADEATLALFTAGTLSPAALDLQSDAYAALMGFTQGEPGMIVICGTGSMLLLVDEKGNQHVSGGWGYLLNDAGSGYTLAREALLRVIDATEGTGPSTPLTALALEYFGVAAPRMIIDRVYAPDFTPDQMAGFAPCVMAQAEQGEPGAMDILTRNMDRLARQAAQLFRKAPAARRVGLYGGIFAHSALARSAFQKKMTELFPRAEICDLQYPPELGAIIHLMRKAGTLNEASLRLLKETYEEIRP